MATNTQLTLRQALLPVVDKLRGLPGKFGLRLFTVKILSRTWTGARAGLGNPADSLTGIKVDLGIYQSKITMVTQRDIIASAGMYTDQDIKVGPITPPFPLSGTDGNAISSFDPIPGTQPTEVFFNISGPGYPTDGAWFKKISQNVTRNFRYDFVVRKTAEVP